MYWDYLPIYLLGVIDMELDRIYISKEKSQVFFTDVSLVTFSNLPKY